MILLNVILVICSGFTLTLGGGSSVFLLTLVVVMRWFLVADAKDECFKVYRLVKIFLVVLSSLPDFDE